MSGGRAVLRRATAASILAILVCACGARDPGIADRRPNILFILADDLGWGDVGFHGSEIETPNIDALAESGVRLEHFYVQPVCSPTRAALLTGRYPMRQGLQVDVIRPWAEYGLPLGERTLPEALREAGYETAIYGKWHLGHARRAYLPTQRGFDRQYGHYLGAIDYFTHRHAGGHDWHRDDQPSFDAGYSTFLLAQEASRAIRDHDSKRPLFIYLPFNAVHTPLQVPPSYVGRYPHLKKPRRTYAGMVTAMDEAIGRILDALDRTGRARSTLIVFASDNGGFAPDVISSNRPYRAGKGTLYEGGVRVPAVVAWNGHIEAGTVVTEALHVVDWYPTLLKLAGARLDQALPLDGRDAWPTITQGSPSPHEEILLNAAPDSGAIVVDPWKLVLGGQHRDAEEPSTAGAPREAREGEIELFDLSTDPSEQENLASDHPEKLRELLARYRRLAEQAVASRNRPKPPGFRSPAVWGESHP